MCDKITKLNIGNHIRCVVLCDVPQYAESAAMIMANQWNHKQSEIERNIESMKRNYSLPCHLALLLNPCFAESNSNNINDTCDSTVTSKEVVVGHTRLVKVNGQSGGSSCVLYSLVVAEQYRGLGLGRILTEEAENYARSLNMSYMYLSTNDKLEFYEHVGYKQCEPVSSLRENSNLLTATQVSSLEGLFAKRLNVCNPCDCNTWLRKRLIQEYTLKEAMSLSNMATIISNKIEKLFYQHEEIVKNKHYVGYIIRTKWQQQTGPSCGIAAINMVQEFSYCHEEHNQFVLCDCVSRKEHDHNGLQKLSTLDLALQLGISNDGELFCAYNLIYLAAKSHQLDLFVNQINDMTCVDVVKSICSGYPVIVPYDRSLSDHTPGMFEGEQAHWAVIIGVLLPHTLVEKGQPCSVLIENDIQLDFYDVSLLSLDFDSSTDINDDMFIICTHGMSSQLFICSFVDIIKSNEQLNTSKSKFYLASKDLKHLRNKMVFFNH